MNFFSLEATTVTPYVNFDFIKGKFMLRGNSSPDNPQNYYSQLYEKMDALNNTSLDKITVNIALSAISKSSLSYIYILVKKIISLQNSNRKVIINWVYNSDSLKYDAEDISEMYGFPINIISIKSLKSSYTKTQQAPDRSVVV